MTTIPLQRARSVPELPSYLLVFALVWAQLALVLAQPVLIAPLPQSTAEAAVPPVDFGKLPLSFVPNAGQEDVRVQFKTQAMGGTIFFTPEEIALRLPTSRSSTAADATVRVQYDGANRNPTIAGEQQLPGVFNSMIGNDPANWHTNIPTYGGIVYQGLYAGIDLRYEGSAGNLKSTYFVAPGSDPAQLRWHYNGATTVGVDRASGDLNIALPGAAAPIIERAPVAWQEIGGMRVPVAASFAIAQDGSVGFALGSYNPAYTLTIDPVLSYSTYLGGAGFDAAYDITVDGTNNVYVTGRTDSATFLTKSAIGGGDVFVVKLSPAGAVVYTSILGGTNFDEGRSIAVDGANQAYITGSTFSSGFSGAINGYTASSDVFITRLDAAGATPVTAYIGGDAADVGNGIAINGSFVVVTGYTDVPTSVGFPAAGGGTATSGGGTDVFYSKLDATLLALSYSTYLGGLSNEEGRDITVDGSGNTYIVGRTGPGFPSAAKSPQSAFGGGNSDAFIVKYDAANAIVASTYLGGTGDDEGYGIAVDGGGVAYVTGSTKSSGSFTASPFQAGYAGLNDAFVAVWNGTGFGYSTYLGGAGDDTGRAIALYGSDIVVAGRTRSVDFPKPAAQALNGAEDAFVTRIDPIGNKLVYSSYIGGNNDDMAYGLALQTDGVAVIAGQTNSNSGLSKAGAAQAVYGGGSYDAFVSKVTQPTVSFAGAPINRAENNTTAFNVPITLSAASNQAVTVTVTIDAGATATSGADYTTTPPLPATVTIPAGATSTSISVSMIDDIIPEPTESFTMTLSAPINASLGTQPSKQINILDNDSPPTVSIGNVTVAEGDSGTTPAVFNVTLSKGFVYTVTMDYATAPGTATAPSDYVAIGTSPLTFAPGETTKPITVTVNGDTTYEADETFAVNISNARYLNPPSPTVPVTITKSTGVGTITNDDTAVAMTITGPGSVPENAGPANFTVALAAPAGITVTVNYATANGTAIAPADYTAASSTLTFAPGETSKVVPVTLVDDALDEDDETFTLNLSNVSAGAVLPDPPQASATITDNDNPPAASIGDVTVTEGDSGSISASFPVTLTAASGKVITMTATTADGSAASGADYTATTTTVVFQPGQTSQTVAVPVLGDTIDEDDETFVVNLSAPENVTIADGQGVGTITDDDAAPTLAISDVTLPEGDSGTTAFAFTVTLSGATARTVTVDYGTADDTATTADNDYSAVTTSTLTFAPGETTKTVTVNVNGDTTDEADESFFVNLSNATNSTLADGQGVGVISDDDGPVLTVSSGSVAEGNSGTTAMVFTATLATTSLQDVSVTYATQDGTATAGTDYVAVASTTLVIPAGQTTATFSVTINGDRVTEADEQFTVVLSNVVQAKLPTPSTTGTIINDDTTPVAADDAYTLDEDTVLTVAAAEGVLANDVDPDADEALTVALVNGPASGTLSLQPDGSFTYTPAANYYGVVTFTYQVTDLGGNVSNVAIVTLTINSVNDPATAADDYAGVGKNVPTRINVLANDSPGPDPDDSLTITEITFAPTSGTVAITNNGTDVTYTPNLDYKGNDTFVYQVCDNDTPQYCATARVTVSVGLFRMSLPLMAKIPQPDLVATLSVSQPNVQPYQRVVFTAKVTNQGTAPASNFWVDLHLNPERVPRVNEPWNEICNPRACRGVAWFVSQTVQPGESIELTTTPDSYVKENTVWLGFFEPGEQRFYLYVDSWNRDPANTQRNPNGSVEESNEANNLFELDLLVTKGSGNAAPAQMPELPNVADLAPRSLEPRSQQ